MVGVLSLSWALEAFSCEWQFPSLLQNTGTGAQPSLQRAALRCVVLSVARRAEHTKTRGEVAARRKKKSSSRRDAGGGSALLCLSRGAGHGEAQPDGLVGCHHAVTMGGNVHRLARYPAGESPGVADHICAGEQPEGMLLRPFFWRTRYALHRHRLCDGIDCFFRRCIDSHLV